MMPPDESPNAGLDVKLSINISMLTYLMTASKMSDKEVMCELFDMGNKIIERLKTKNQWAAFNGKPLKFLNTDIPLRIKMCRTIDEKARIAAYEVWENKFITDTKILDTSTLQYGVYNQMNKKIKKWLINNPEPDPSFDKYNYIQVHVSLPKENIVSLWEHEKDAFVIESILLAPTHEDKKNANRTE